MKTMEFIDNLEKEVTSLRNEAEDKVDIYEQHNLKMQAAAIGYEVKAYNNVLRLLREARREAERQSRRTYVYESNITDVEIKWL